ncbi:uncharacterized protein I303_102459 [Kwoniella dejecticola CBS 10117]|uniref:Uncharacterized protein n=1 Tax=Kwoniella dejecticola CBS 10117 TaxID=1296121 RepID=A0A1A6A8U2_9TREE|nr:uncharacterized protein I303_02474 [Kwoniella dejecticola CBS 10117]OBR86467.1 hypothetical protein I303_02474 [Kwoniella dejecticola CBS 10117]
MAKEPPNSSQKRAAPISASAFAFSLSTPRNKKPKVSTNGTTPLSSLRSSAQTPNHDVKEEPATPLSHPRLPREQSQTPLRTLNQDEDHHQFTNMVETPRKVPILKPLNAFSTPFTPKQKLGDLDPRLTSSKTLRRLNERVRDVTPLKDKTKELELDSKPKFALHETLLSDQTKGDLMLHTKKALLEEDEGLGVSPRGKRIAKWSGRGATPPSVHLANLLSSSNASTHLFYTSMQHLLYPSQRAGAAMLKNRISTGETSANSVSPLQHIENSATIQMKIIEPVQGATHNSIIFRCEPINSGDQGKAGTVPVVFQPLPSECPKLGIDPKLLAMKMRDDARKEWRLGVWAWTEVEIPMGPEERWGDGTMVTGTGTEGIIGDAKSMKALIVTRYLIVERPFVG